MDHKIYRIYLTNLMIFLILYSLILFYLSNFLHKILNFYLNLIVSTFYFYSF